jgi:telomere length regulation protein
MTTLLLVTVSYLPSTSEKVQNLILSPSFVTAIGYYISHMDESIRLCGMLVAEVLSSLAEKVLAFDVWDGEDETRLWAHRVRELIKGHANANGTNVQGANIVDYEEEITQPEPQVQDIIPAASNQILLTDDGFDSDDSMTGYAPSLSPLATSSELAEVEKEPVLSFGIKRISRPLYLSQLGALLRSRDDNGQSGQSSAADNVEMALNSAEDLIRRKRDFGSELGAWFT